MTDNNLKLFYLHAKAGGEDYCCFTRSHNEQEAKLHWRQWLDGFMDWEGQWDEEEDDEFDLDRAFAKFAPEWDEPDFPWIWQLPVTGEAGSISWYSAE